jgi:formate dehydrogenase iron-sulfur subunit
MACAMLIDTTRCIGCRGCQVACKSWKDLPAERSTFSATGTNPLHLDAENFTRVLFEEGRTPAGAPRWSFVKRQCMHCNEPACAGACPVAALVKLPEGPVVYRDDRCIGCRYCMVACPFQIPKFQWNATVPYVRKCNFCAERLALGKKPACAATCPSEALLFGDRTDLLREAHRRIETNPGHYVGSVYGEKTGGGTSMLYLTAVPFEQLGLDRKGFRTDLGEVPHAQYGQEWMAKVPWLAATVGAVSLALYRLNQRRAEVEKQDGKEIAP